MIYIPECPTFGVLYISDSNELYFHDVLPFGVMRFQGVLPAGVFYIRGALPG